MLEVSTAGIAASCGLLFAGFDDDDDDGDGDEDKDGDDDEHE